MAKVERSITINTPVKKVFAYITDPANRMEWLPSTTDVRDVTGLGVRQRWGYTYKMAGISLKGENEVTEFTSNQRYAHKSTGGIVSTWTYTFNPVAGGTRLSLVVEYTIPVPVLGKMAKRLVLLRNGREVNFAMATIKERLEE